MEKRKNVQVILKSLNKTRNWEHKKEEKQETKKQQRKCNNLKEVEKTTGKRQKVQ